MLCGNRVTCLVQMGQVEFITYARTLTHCFNSHITGGLGKPVTHMTLSQHALRENQWDSWHIRPPFHAIAHTSLTIRNDYMENTALSTHHSVPSDHGNTTQHQQFDWVNVLCPTWHKTDHFRDVPQASLLAYKKTKPNTQKQTTQKLNILQLKQKHTNGLMFQVPNDTKLVVSETFPQANLLAWYGKTKPNTTKAHIHQSKETYYNTNTRMHSHNCFTALFPGLPVWAGARRNLFFFVIYGVKEDNIWRQTNRQSGWTPLHPD